MITVHRKIPSAKLRLLIFDLDGTLIDSRQDLANSVNAMLGHFHRQPLPADLIASYVGDGAPTLVRRSLGFPDDHSLSVAEEEFVGEALAYFLEFYREHKLDHTYIYDGVLEALRALRHSQNGAGGRERLLAVLTNKPVGASRAIVEALGLGEFFCRVYGGNSFETKKPDPLGVHTLLREGNCSPEEAVIIGDSDVDVLTARNAGIWSVGVTYGLAPQSLEVHPADVMVDSAAEWTEIFKTDPQ